MSNKLTLKDVMERFGEEYLNLLEDNLWIQGYKKSSKDWQYSYKDLWLPDLSHLWRLCEQFTADDIVIAKEINISKYIVKNGKLSFDGFSPEEALLKLFICLEAL